MPNEVVLSEANRAKLDGIVSKMIANKESDENIKFVVEDFKKKYSETPKKKGSTSQNGAWYSKAVKEAGLPVTDKPKAQKASVFSPSNIKELAKSDEQKFTETQSRLKSDINKLEVEQELSDAEMAQILKWSDADVKRAKQGVPSKNVVAKPANVDPKSTDRYNDMLSSKVGITSNQLKAVNDVESNKTNDLKSRVTYYNNVDTQERLKNKGYDIDVNGNLDDEKTKSALTKENAKWKTYKIEQDKKNEIFDKIDDNIDAYLVSNTEEYVVDELRKKFSGSGFIFEESGMGNYLTVKFTPNGSSTTKEIEIPLAGISSSLSLAKEGSYNEAGKISEENAKKLKDFMKGAYITKSEWKSFSPTDTEAGSDAYNESNNLTWMLRATELMAKNPAKYGKELIGDDVGGNILDKASFAVKNEYKWLEGEYANLKKQIDAYNQNPTDTERVAINNKLHELSVKEYNLNEKANKISQADKYWGKSAAAYALDEAKKGNLIGNWASAYLGGRLLKSTEKALLGLSMDVGADLIGAENLTDASTYQMYKDDGMSDDDIKEKVLADSKRFIMPKLDAAYTRILSLGTTTEEYKKSPDRPWYEQLGSALAESIGAAQSPNAKLGFFSMAYDSMQTQMLGKEFDGLTQSEKMLVSVPYALAVGALEKFGYDASVGFSKSGIFNKTINTVIRKSLTDLPKDATVSQINREINKNVSNLVKSGVIKIAAGSITEGNVEGIQGLTEIGTKAIVNELYDKELFQDIPDLSTKDGLIEAVGIASEDAALGALGGLIMGGGAISTTTYKQAKFNETSDYNFDVFYGTLMDDNLRKSIKYNTKIKLKNGEMTESEAKEEIESIDRNTGILRSIPADLSLRDKKDSFNLIIERNKLEQEIDGKDAALIVKQKARISEINNELNKISENATKENNVEQQKDTTEGSKVEYQGVVKGQQEAGSTEGTVGQTTQQKTDTGDSTVAGETQEVTRSIINRPSTLSEFGGKKFDTPIQGDTYVQGKQVVFEDRATGRMYELGNVDEVIDSTIPGLNAQPELVSVTKDGKISVEGSEWNIQSELPTMGIEYNPAGEVERVSLKDDNGNTTMFDGQKAVDIAYQIELQKIQSPEQQQLINELLEQDEEFKSATADIKLTEAPVATEEKAVTDTEQTAQQTEKVIEQQPAAQPTRTVEQEVEELGQLISGSDVEIDNAANVISNKRMSKVVAKAAKAIARITPGVKFKVYEDDASYRQAVDETTEGASSSGTFDPSTNTVHINLTNANNRTVAHEVFHAILLNKVRTNKDAAAVTKKMIEAISSKLEGMPELKKYLDDFASNYDENIQNEEKLSELVGILADNYMNSPASVKDIIARWIDRLAKMFGLDPFQRNEVYDMLNTIARKTAKGKTIKEKDIKLIPKGDTIEEMNKRFQADFSDSVSKLTFIFDKNGGKFKKLEDDGYITKDKSLSDFNGKYVFLHQPDAAFSGMIYKDGEILVEGKGGVFYPIKFHEDGYFWASTSTTAIKMADDLNKVMEQNEGTIYMALTSAPNNKLMSSTTMSNAVLDFFSSKALDKNFKINPNQLKLSLIKAANDVKFKKTKNKTTGVVTEKPFGLRLKLTPKLTIEEIQSAIRTKLASDKSSFEDRKNFAIELTKLMATEINKNDVAVNQFGKLFSEGIQNKYFKGITKTGKLKISAANMTQALSEMFTEPMLKEGVDRDKGGQVYAILELNGAVKPFKTDQHESYPMAIKSDSDSKVKLHILKDRQNWYDVFEDFETNEIVASKERQSKIYPTSGVSVRGLRVNTSKIEGKPTTEELATPRNQKTTKVYNASPKEVGELGKRSGVVYFATDKREADAYALMNRGEVREFDMPTSLIKDEKVVKDKIKELGLQPKDTNYTIDESSVYELIDDRFDNSLSPQDINKLFSALKKDGVKAFSYEDGAQVSGRTTESIAVIDTDVVQGMVRKQQASKKDINKVIKVAKSKDFSNDAIRQYLLKEGFSEDQINNAMAPYEYKDKVMSDFNKNFDKLVKEGATEDNAFNEAIENIVYKVEDDIVREEIIRELKKEYGKRIKSAPRAEKITGKAKPITIITDDVKGLTDVIKREIKAAKDKKNQVDAVLTSISAQVKDMVVKGKISVRQMSAIINALKNTNLDNQVMVDRFVDYVSRVISRADFIERVNKGMNFKKAIKRNLKGKANPFVAVAKSFTELNPKWVVDIDKYNEIAELVFNSVKPTRISKGEISFKTEADIELIGKYIAEEQANHLKIKEENLRALYEKATGEKSEGKSVSDMLDELRSDKVKTDYTDKIKAALKEKIKQYEELVTENDPKEVKQAIKIDVDLIDAKLAIGILDALDTYFANDSNASLKALMATYKGIVMAKNFKLVAKPLRLIGSKKVGRAQSQEFTNINIVLKRMFRGQNAALSFMEAVGFSDIIQGSNRAERQAMNKQNEYSRMFNKVKNFNSAENIFERNVIAFIARRDINANAEESINKRIKLLKDSVDVLRKSGTSIEIAKADLYEKVLKKLGLYEEGATLESARKKAESYNLSAVDFVTNMFSEIYDPLSDTALGVYNTMLENDINYTPDKYSTLDAKIGKDEFDLDSSGFMMFNSNFKVDENKASVLMSTNRPERLPKNMYVDLDFDSNMFRSYRLALNDMYTAEAIRQANAFINSDEFENIIPTAEDRAIVESAIKSYVITKKGKNYIEKSSISFMNSILDTIGGLGAARALGGFSQFLNQLGTAQMNTFINAGEYMRPFDIFDNDLANMIANSGLPISNLGVEALTTIENTEKELEKVKIAAGAISAIDKYGLSYIKKSNEKLLKVVLSNPDRYARIQAFAAYYRKSMKAQGLKADFSAPMNEKAARYAQAMIDANMDVTDTAMRGKFFTDKESYKKIIKQVFFPFSTFSLNQRNRVWSDIAVVGNKLSSKEDFWTAVRSSLAFSAEFFTYNAIRYGVGLFLIRTACEAMGLDDDEEEAIVEKYTTNLLKSIKSGAVTDILSPSPVFDEATLNAMNKLMLATGIGSASEEEFQKYISEVNDKRAFQGKEPLTEDEVKDKKDKFFEDEQFQFYVDNEKSSGMLGIQYSKLAELYDILKARSTGYYTREKFAGGGEEEVKLSDDAKEKLDYIALLKLVGTTVGTREVDQIADKMFKIAKEKYSLTEKQNEKYEAVKKKYKVDPYKMSLITSSMKEETMIEEIEYIESTGGLTPKQSKEYAKLRAYGAIDGWGLDDIRKGKTTEQIIASRK
jgi:hypothetical protein